MVVGGSAVLAVGFVGGGDPDPGPSGGVVVLAVLAFLVLVPAVVGLLLRLRDTRRGDDGRREEPTTRTPPYSNALGGHWGQRFDPRRESTAVDWVVVGVLVGAILIYLIATHV